MNKQKILERDKYSCQLCGVSHNLESVPHHCFFRSEYFKKDADDDWNLITICLDCHRKIHQKGDKNKEKIAKQIALTRYNGKYKLDLNIIMRVKKLV